MNKISFYLVLGFVALIGLSAQPSKMRSCGVSGDHPCHCLVHVQAVQSAYMDACIAARMKEKPSEAASACMAAMPQHCSIVEHYGNWSTGEDGEHNAPMPQQCTSACKIGHCRCNDGPTCHFAHDPAEDRRAK